MFFQKEIETMSRGEIESLQLERLKWIVDYCDRNVEFYHKRLQKAGVTADKIKSLKDVRYIPVTVSYTHLPVYAMKDDPTKLPMVSHVPLVEDLADAILNDRKPMITPREARHAVDMILSIYRSSREGKEIVF